MKQLVLVAALSALASSALTVLLSSAFRPAPAAPGSASMSAADFKAALGDLEREVAALRREMGEMAVAAPAGRAPLDRSVAGEANASDAGRPDRATVRTASDEPGSPDTATQLGRFQAIFPRDEDGERDYGLHRANVRRWMFRGEREVLEWFGVPTTVSENEGGGETWGYAVPTGEKEEDGDPVTEEFWIRLNRGRVIDLSD